MRREKEGKDRSGTPSPGISTSFKTGAIALIFLFLGFELALFVREAAVDVIVAHRDAPDTVYVYRSESSVETLCAEVPLVSEIKGNVATCAEIPLAPEIKGNVARGTSAQGASAAPQGRGNASKGTSAPGAASSSNDRQNGATGTSAPGAAASRGYGNVVTRKDAEHTRKATSLYEQRRGRRVESFQFDPNTVTSAELQRLGFSEKQAASILSYRAKGGRFHRKEDFARSYVVADSVYARLEAFIDIPLLDINAADSAAFDRLPGIGGWFASKMVEYRERIGGYSSTEQLLEIYNFGMERYDGLKDLVFAGPRP